MHSHEIGECGAGPTINTNNTISIAGVLSRILFVGALLLGVVGVGIITAPSTYAATNQQMNFQGRLLNAQGAVVPDGYYNVQFKIYQDGTGTAANNPGGTLKWTESWLNTSSQGVLVVNGYMSVQLGSINPFGTQIDWNSDTLWLSINIGNTNVSCTPFTSCTPDGEMLPMKRLSAVAYAMNATMLGGRDATGFIQNTTTPQTANIAIQSAASGNVGAVIQGAASQAADIFQIKADSVATPLLAVSNVGSVTITPTSDAAPALTVNSTTGIILSAAASGIDLHNNTTVNGNALVKSTTGNDSATAFQVQNAAGVAVLKQSTLNGALSIGTLTFAPNNSSLASLWDSGSISGSAYNDATQLELGMVFKSSVAGQIMGMKFYNVSGHNTGSDVGKLWQCNDANCNLGSGGSLLASVTFSNDTTAGWKIASFSSPVAIDANKYYIVTHYTPSGAYYADVSYFSAAHSNGTLLSPASSTIPNGVSRVGSAGFPNNSYLQTNYWTDVVFSATGSGDVFSSTNSLAISSEVQLTLGSAARPTTLLGSSVSIGTTASGNTATTINGTLLIKPTTGNDSVAAFQVQGAGGGAALTVDTTNRQIIVGSATTDPTANLTNGAMYYNTATSRFRCYQGGAWVNCVGADGNFINNSSTQQTSANFNIDGTGAADVLQATSHVYTTDLDRLSAGTLTIGTNATNTTAITLGSDGMTTTIAGNLTSGSAAGTGTFTNNGATLNAEKTYGNFVTSGALDTAANSVDKYTYFSILQTTSSQTITLPTPTTNPTSLFGRIIHVSNIGTASFTVAGSLIMPGYTATFIWSNTDGAATGGETWQYAGDGGGSGNYIQNQTDGAQSGSNFWIQGVGRADTALTTPAIRAIADSTSAIKIQNAAGSTNVMTIDTTNSRVGIAMGAAEAATYDLSFGGGSDRVIGINANTGTGTGRQLTIHGGASNGTDQAGGALLLQGGVGTGTAAGGAVNILGGTTGAGATGAVNIQTTLNGNVAIGNAGDAANAVTLTAGTTSGISLLSDKIVVGNATTTTTIQKTGQTGTSAGSQLTIQGATSGTTGVGGAVLIQGGNSATGTTGGNLTLAGGTGTTTNGAVILATSTFQTLTNDANCFATGEVAASCTITAAAINNNASVIVGFSTDGQVATMPDPTINTAGRVVYVTASNASKDFTLRANTGEGTGIEQNIAMRKNTTATMIWNGANWTAAGASSSTTLQAAYDNTLQSSGGAELVVSKTGATNGLTIRDSSNVATAVNGTLLSVQTSSAAGLFQVNSNVTEYASDAGAEVYGASSTVFPSNTWSAITSATVTRQNTTGNYIATGQGSVSVQTAASANSGVVNTLVNSAGTPTALTANNHYNVSFTARLDAAYSNFTNLNVYYSINGSAQSVTCATGQTVPTSVWAKINCSFTAPSSGITSTNAILIQQSDATLRKFYIDNLSVTIAADYNLATDGSVDDNTNFGTNWTAVSGATITRSTTYGNDASDSASVAAISAGQGVRNKLSMNPLPGTLYRVTVYAASTTAFTDFTVRYSRDGGTSFVACADYNTQNISTSLTAFTKVTCYIKTDGTAASNPYVYFTQTAAGTRTFYVDTFSMTLSSASTPNVQIGGGVNGGPTTLFTVDKGASAPIAANNDALLGSMYYDTTLGKLQCYESDGWGACGSSPDNIITISPEYTNAVLHGTGIGTMTSDICSDYLDINDGTSGQSTICGSNETYNFYKWTSPQATAQTYSIYVTYQLPGTFKSFNSGQTSLMGRTDSANSSVSYQIYRSNASGLTPCGSSISVSSGVQSTWQTATASGSADPSTCSFTAGNSIVVKITITASQNANAYVGNLNFAFSNK